ncbi:unnamed protein product, partial [Rotaria magnacalcarata]
TPAKTPATPATPISKKPIAITPATATNKKKQDSSSSSDDDKQKKAPVKASIAVKPVQQPI